MEFLLKQLSTNDGCDIYDMLQHIGENENEFKNTANGLSYDEYKNWLIEQDDWSNGHNLPVGYVPQTIFWLMADGIPVGIGKVRHSLNDHSRTIGGNLGYAIDSRYRGRGYATKLVGMLVEKADEIGVEEKLLTVEKFNYPSKAVIEKNGGTVFYENEQRWFFHI